MLPDAVVAHYRAQQRLTVATLAWVRREWAKMGEDFDSSWPAVGRRLTTLVAAAQLGAAKNGASYVPRALDELDMTSEPVAEVQPEAFSGITSAGMPLDSMLYGAVVKAREADAKSLPDRLMAGRNWLDMAVQTQIADTARSASSAAITVRPDTGWIRMVNPPCCERCAILSGKWFKWNEGFDRHPRCDCYHIPAREMTPDLRIAPDDLIKEGKVTGVSRAERQAIDDGADAIAVINARRGRNGMWTTEGTTRRGYASHIKREIARQKGEIAKETATSVGRRGYIANYKVRRTGPRPTPAAIYKYATSREEAIKLLAANGYIVGSTPRVVRMATA